MCMACNKNSSRKVMVGKPTKTTTRFVSGNSESPYGKPKVRISFGSRKKT